MLLIRYLVVVNVITFIVFGYDKIQAINNRYRVTEKTLILLIMVGGPLASLIAMKLFHHKINKKKFWYLSIIMMIFYIYLVIEVS